VNKNATTWSKKLGFLVIVPLQVLDSGNFSVEVVVWTAAGDVVTLYRSAFVHVTNDLQTADGHLYVTQDTAAAYSSQTGQFHVMLRCGVFTYPTRPVFDAHWQTPSGHSLASSGYHDNQFFLLVPNPVEGGAYSCNIQAVQACIHSNHSAVASLTLDKLEARLVVLEATMEAKVAQLQTENTALKETVTDLKANDAVQDRELNILKRRVSFHARNLNNQDNVPANSALKFPTVITNEGGAYNPSSEFVAPFNATYFFMANTVDWSDRIQDNMALVVDITDINHMYTCTADRSPASIQGVCYGREVG
jgi:hypothetical protein